jgi:Bacterial Ig-like domain
MQRVSNRLIYVALATMLVAGCSDSESRTDLNPDGPPMIRQVRMFEKYVDGTLEKSRRVFAFGTHELAEEEEVAGNRPAGMVTTAAALNGATGNKMRVIIDELILGNNLEQIACRAPVDLQGSLSRVPNGATPEDIARCSVADDVLPKSCPASNPRSVCICKNPNGCLLGTTQIATGMPVGVLDIDKDGAADETRMIDGAIQIRCGAGGAISVPLDLDASYWNPSGDQNRPAIGGFEALGPAVVLQPTTQLPTNLECQLAFADGTDKFKGADGLALPAIVDKQNIQLCAPPNGDVEQACTPGDTSAFKFKVEPMALIADTTIFEGATGINKNINPTAGGQVIDIVFNVPVNPATITGITFSPALPAGATLTIVGVGNMGRTVRLTGPNPLTASTMYTATIAVTDTYNQPLPQTVIIHFTTGA